MFPNLSALVVTDTTPIKRHSADPDLNVNNPTLDDFGMDELLLIIDKYLHTADIRIKFASPVNANGTARLSSELDAYVNRTICATNKQWEAACASPTLWKHVFEEEKKQLLEAIAKEDAGDVVALNDALARAKASPWKVMQEWGENILEEVQRKPQPRVKVKPRNVKQMFLARNGLDIDNIMQSYGATNEDNFLWVYLIALVQLYGAWDWLTLHVVEWPHLADDDITKVVNTEGLHANSLEDNFGPMEAWDTSELTSLAELFFDDPNKEWQHTPLGLWDVSKVESFAYLFYRATEFDQPLGQWNVSSGRNFQCMFRRAEEFNQPLAKWNVSEGVNFKAMFSMTSTFNQPLDNWDVIRGLNFAGMFQGAERFNQPLGTWDIDYDDSKPKIYDYMFHEAVNFEQDLRRWLVGPNDSAVDMFEGSNMNNQPEEYFPKISN